MARQALGAALVGFGYWGPNLARNLSASADFDLLHICDLSPGRVAAARGLYPAVDCGSDASHAIGDDAVDAVFVATPAVVHHRLAVQAIEAGKHVLVEKPLTLDAATSDDLVARAAGRGVVLAVDHTFVYTGAVQKLRDLVNEGDLGDLRSFDSMRVNLGIVQPDVDVFWDLAVHDLSILQYVTDRTPVSVSATGMAHAPSTHASTAYMTLFYEDDFIAHVDVSWMSPVKVRRTLLAGTRRMVVYDDLEPSEKVKVYDAGVDSPETSEERHSTMVSYRTGDMIAPKLDSNEALSTEIAHLAECIRENSVPRASGAIGASVVRTLEAATASIVKRGAPVDLEAV
jgi:predicted dehydrogenase